MTKVSPEGSAARSGGVDVGDQLAAINGKSSDKMKVADICSLIAHLPNPKIVQLAFVRYQGPLRPSNQRRKSDSFEAKVDSGFIEGQKTLAMAVSAPAGRKKSIKEPTIIKVKPPQNPNKKGFRWFGRGKKKDMNAQG